MECLSEPNLRVWLEPIINNGNWKPRVLFQVPFLLHYPYCSSAPTPDHPHCIPGTPPDSLLSGLTVGM